MEMSPAEVAAVRTLMGLSQDQLAAALGRNKRVVRAWEMGNYVISQESFNRLWALKREHDCLVREMLDADVAVVPRTPADDGRPRGWHLAAAGRAIAVDPDLMVEWDDEGTD